MLRVIHSLPDSCPACSAASGGGRGSLKFEGDSWVCFSCGTLVEVSEPLEEEEEAAEKNDLVASIDLTSCPHCTDIGSLAEYAGYEWCNSCGLDPNVEDYASESLMYLWKPGSGIQKVMELNAAVLAPHKRMGTFLRSMCGPKCEYAKVCPQTVKNLAICGNEDWEASRTEDEMSKKRRRKGKHKKHKNNRQHSFNPFHKDEPQPSVLMCSKSGWFEEMMYDKIAHRQRSGVEGSGSGT